ncbi:Flp family type IVb pilin [Neobacillus novalis]|uniref:Flp family type IVb pilin n=1 Tax=Neobacillus novalis TaxID=220687 RepID=A0AA95MPS3_9BACI|nr:Flp family type IVb pilin [Neobacillus novalis]WHY87706.1 Flp family type IVb pilin [Neobacillus novalis]
MMKKMKALLTEEQGQGMTEYGLVLGVIAVGVVTILIAMRGQITGLFTKAQEALTEATK